jgi:L-ascorbate metabolism protein UlaG (beta-lactamase superfamily)
MNPEEAVRAFLELKAKRMVPMHYGSFRLSYEPLEEPLTRLGAAVRQHRIESMVSVLNEGVPTVF